VQVFLCGFNEQIVFFLIFFFFNNNWLTCCTFEVKRINMDFKVHVLLESNNKYNLGRV